MTPRNPLRWTWLPMPFQTQTFKNIFFDHTTTVHTSYQKAPIHLIFRWLRPHQVISLFHVPKNLNLSVWIQLMLLRLTGLQLPICISTFINGGVHLGIWWSKSLSTKSTKAKSPFCVISYIVCMDIKTHSGSFARCACVSYFTSCTGTRLSQAWTLFSRRGWWGGYFQISPNCNYSPVDQPSGLHIDYAYAITMGYHKELYYLTK